MKKTAMAFSLLLLLHAPLQAGECKVALVFEGQTTEQLSILAELLTSTLRQEQGLTLVEEETLEGPVTLERAASLGKRAGVEVVMIGSLKAESYRLDARLIEVQSGVVRAAPSVSGAKGEVFDLVDALGKKLSENLHAGGGKPHRVVIFDYANLASAEYGPFVRGLPDMLATNLGQARGLSLVERTEIEEGWAHFFREPGQVLSPDEAAEMGAWLGADWVVAGSFTEVIEVRVKLVEVRTGRLLAEQRAEGGWEEIADQVAQLGGVMAQRLRRLAAQGGGALFREPCGLGIRGFCAGHLGHADDLPGTG